MADTTPPDCLNCRWWREQSGSAHVVCPTRMEFSWHENRTTCDLFGPVQDGETIDRGPINQFMFWGGSADSGMPSDDEIIAWFDAHPEYKTEAFNAARVKHDAEKAD